MPGRSFVLQARCNGIGTVHRRPSDLGGLAFAAFFAARLALRSSFACHFAASHSSQVRGRPAGRGGGGFWISMRSCSLMNWNAFWYRAFHLGSVARSGCVE